MELNQLIRQAENTEVEAVLLETEKALNLHGVDLTPEARFAAKRWLAVHNLLAEESLSGEIELNYEGRRLAKALYESRTNGEMRLDTVTREIAKAIDESRDYEEVTDVEGRAVTLDERHIALTRLEAWNLISADHALGDDFARVDRKPGLSQVRSIHGRLTDHFQHGSVVDSPINNVSHIYDSNVGGVQVGGSNNSQIVHQSISAKQEREIVDLTSQALDILEDVDGAEELREKIKSIQDSARMTGDKTTLKERILDAMAIAGASTTATALVPQIPVIISQLAGIITG